MLSLSAFCRPQVLGFLGLSLFLTATSAQQCAGQVVSDEPAPQPIERLPIRIVEPGLYHLSADLEYAELRGGAISIEADDVTIDLSGRTLTGLGGAATLARGIYASNRRNIIITNGRISGFYFGIDIRDDSVTVKSRSSGHVVSKMHLDRNWYFGMRVMGSGCEISDCQIIDTGGCTREGHTIPHGARLVGERNVMHACCIRNLRLKRSPDGKGEIVGVHFDAARDSVFEDNRVIEQLDKTEAAAESKDDTTERRFGLWINGGRAMNTMLTVRNNTFAGFTVPIVFAPGADGSATGNTFHNAVGNPIRGKPTGRIGDNRSLDSAARVECASKSRDQAGHHADADAKGTAHE